VVGEYRHDFLACNPFGQVLGNDFRHGMRNVRALGVVAELIGNKAHRVTHHIDIVVVACGEQARINIDRKSTRLNSSHVKISYASSPSLFPYTTLFRSRLSGSTGTTSLPAIRSARFWETIFATACATCALLG